MFYKSTEGFSRAVFVLLHLCFSKLASYHISSHNDPTPKKTNHDLAPHPTQPPAPPHSKKEHFKNIPPKAGRKKNSSCPNSFLTSSARLPTPQTAHSSSSCSRRVARTPASSVGYWFKNRNAKIPRAPSTSCFRVLNLPKTPQKKYILGRCLEL